MHISDQVREKLRSVPDRPGCYVMRNRRGAIIYVGKALSLRKRVRSYFREASLRRGSPKLSGLVHSVHDIEFIVTRNEAEAILAEGRLIKEYRPRYNVSFRDDKRFLLIRVATAEPFPALKLCRFRREDGALYFGPYASSAAGRAALDFAEKQFGLRKCMPRIPDAETYRHCINDIVRFCSAPCVGRITSEQYHERLAEACAFLRGERPRYLADLRQRMDEAARAMNFEKAAALRDTLFSVQAAIRQKARDRVRVPGAGNGVNGVEELGRVLGSDVPLRRIEAFDISNIMGTHAVAGMVSFEGGRPMRNRYRRFRIRTVRGADDPAMIAEAVGRRYRRLQGEGGILPDLVLVDGGITQLRAAQRVLRRLGLASVRVAGLAKQLEEVHHGESGAVIRLPAGSAALHLLQRVRDEAHRFALSYHRRLRARRITESVIDEIPGVGPRKKMALLTRFGSVRRLAATPVEALAAVPGIGPALAQAIAAHLADRR